MMKKISFLISFAVFLFGLSSSAQAQVQDMHLLQEVIVSYGSDIRVNADNSIDVTETIVYNTGPLEHHGIYRDIYPYSSQKKKMDIEDVNVTDETGDPYIFQTSKEGNNLRIKIGDPNSTFSGQKTYVIRYHATRAVAQLENLDEIYWNVTGNGWAMPIYEARVSVTLPSGAQQNQSECYVGATGSTERCRVMNGSDGVYGFESTRPLNPYEGVTVAVGFPKGFVTPYPVPSAFMNFLTFYGKWIVIVMLPILALFFSLRSWYIKGRDDRKTRLIIPQYDVADGLTPMEVGGIVDEKVDESQISAEIIYLATKGYLKIRKIEEKTLGIFKSTDYELIKLKDDLSDLSESDKKLLDGLFGGVSSIKFSDLKYVFYKDANLVVKSALDALKSKGYYKNIGRMRSGSKRMVLIVFFAIWGAGFFGAFFGTILFENNPFPLMISIFLTVIIYGIISHFNPSKTEKGVAAKEYLLGLKEYLQIAEKNRLEFHNAPEKNPEIFETLLPYAMVLGVADIWAKEFEDIYMTPPSWYDGVSGSSFSASAFNSSLVEFNSFAASSLMASPGSSGSGGGGSSGGGGGGGGGGSW